MRVGKGSSARSLESSSRVDLSRVKLQHSACLDLALFEDGNLICMLRSSFPKANNLAGLFSDGYFAALGADGQYKPRHPFYRLLIFMLKCLVSFLTAT